MSPARQDSWGQSGTSPMNSRTVVMCLSPQVPQPSPDSCAEDTRTLSCLATAPFQVDTFVFTKGYFRWHGVIPCGLTLEANPEEFSSTTLQASARAAVTSTGLVCTTWPQPSVLRSSATLALFFLRRRSLPQSRSDQHLCFLAHSPSLGQREVTAPHEQKAATPNLRRPGPPWRVSAAS